MNKYASFQAISRALRLGVSDQPGEKLLSQQPEYPLKKSKKAADIFDSCLFYSQDVGVCSPRAARYLQAVKNCSTR